jgi:hypothetical protein
MVYRNGYRLGGSTPNSDLKSTPASDASTPNANNTRGADGGDNPRPHEDRVEPETNRRNRSRAAEINNKRPLTAGGWQVVGQARVTRRLLLICGAAGTGKSARQHARTAGAPSQLRHSVVIDDAIVLINVVLVRLRLCK